MMNNTSKDNIPAAFVDGFYKVGVDILPGTYRTRSESNGCSYQRLNGYGEGGGKMFVQNREQVISNNISAFPLIVTIDETDAAFESKHCATWTQDLSQITNSKTSFGSGMYIVGTDIEPGAYTNSNPSKAISGCQYKRLSGFSGEEKDTIYEWIVDGTTKIEIKSSDKGFWSEGCGTWTLN